MPLVEKVILAIQETSTSCHIIRTNIFHFTDGEGLMVNFRYFCSTINDALYSYIPGCRDFQNKCLGVGENITEGCITYQCNHQGDRIGLDAVQAGKTCIHNKL